MSAASSVSKAALHHWHYHIITMQRFTIEIRCTRSVMYLNHPETTSSPCSLCTNCLPQNRPWCPKGWGPRCGVFWPFLLAWPYGWPARTHTCPEQLSFSLRGRGLQREGAFSPRALWFSAVFVEYCNIVTVKSLGSGLSWFTVQGCVMLLGFTFHIFEMAIITEVTSQSQYKVLLS